jgi:hypothetical protein
MDCSIVPLEGRSDLFMVSTHDFFYPLIEDPYLQGRIACCNVLSDLYSMGVKVQRGLAELCVMLLEPLLMCGLILAAYALCAADVVSIRAEACALCS